VEEERFEPVSPEAPLLPSRPPAVETEPSEPSWPAEPPSLPPVQRRPDRDIPARAEARPTEEALPVEVERVEPVSPEVLAPPSSLTQRRAEFAEPPPQPDEPATGLERDLLARGAVRARRPLTEPLRPGRDIEPKQERVETPEPAEPIPGAHDRLLQTKPLEQTAILPQARGPTSVADEQTQGLSADLPVPDRSRPYTLAHPLPVPRRAVISRRETGVERVEIADGSAVRPQLLEGELPLPLLRQPVSTERVQRQPDVGRVDAFPGLTAAPESVGIVQRVSTRPSPETERTSKEKSDLELDRLARQVYPFIKRLLAVERERRSGRWS